MENKTKNIIRIVSIILLTLLVVATVIILTEKPTFADSGFSASYSGGGSYSSSSSSSYSSSHGSSSSDPEDALIGLIIFVVIMVLSIVCGRTQNNKSNTQVTARSLTNEEINKYIPNFDRQKFLNEAFDIYKQVQIAWMNFDLDNVKDIITDEMYNMYESQLATLQVKGEKNIMENMNIKSSIITNITNQNDMVTITVVSQITQNDYIINEATGKVLRGNKNVPMHMTYELKYRMSIDENAKLETCPNCGAKLENMNGATTCEYCNSKVVADNTKWVLTEKKVLMQR